MGSTTFSQRKKENIFEKKLQYKVFRVFSDVLICVCVEPTLPRSECSVRHPMGARPNAGHSCGQLSFPFYFFSIVNTCILNANLTIPLHYLSTSICERQFCMSFTAHISSHSICIRGAYKIGLNEINQTKRWNDKIVRVLSNGTDINRILHTFSTFILFHSQRNGNGKKDMKNWSHLLLVLCTYDRNMFLVQITTKPPINYIASCRTVNAFFPRRLTGQVRILFPNSKYIYLWMFFPTWAKGLKAYHHLAENVCELQIEFSPKFDVVLQIEHNGLN